MSNQKQKDEELTRHGINNLGLKSLYLSSLLALPLAYIFYRFVQYKLSENLIIVFAAGGYLVTSTIIWALISNWIGKKPHNSKWHIFLD
jgi:hypothetical protein